MGNRFRDSTFALCILRPAQFESQEEVLLSSAFEIG